MKPAPYRKVLILLAALLLAAGTRLDGQVSPKTVTGEQLVAPNGSATVNMTFTYDAAAWAQWRATTGKDPARTRAAMRYNFGAEVAFDGFKMDCDDLNRTAKVMLHSAVASELRPDGGYALPVDKDLRLVNGAGQVWFFSGVMANTLSTLKIVLPTQATDAALVNGGEASQAIVYTLPPVPGSARKYTVAGAILLALGLVLLGIRAGLGRARPAAPPLLALGLLLFFPGPPCAGQVPGSLGAPAWIHPGMRMTFYLASATIDPGMTLELDDNAQPDENGMVWTDGSGRKYRPTEGGRASGQSYIQVNVEHLDQQIAVLSLSNYGIDVATGAVRAPHSSGLVSTAHTGSDFWMHPKLLEGMTDQPAVGVRVFRMPYKVGGRTYQAIALKTKQQTGYAVCIYDRASGILLSRSSASQPAAKIQMVDAYGRPINNGSGRVLTEARLVGTREVSVPWKGLPTPDWVAQMHSLIYGGTHSVTVSGSYPIALGYRVSLNVQRGGPGWVLLSQRSETANSSNMPIIPTEDTWATGTNQLAGLWIPPAGLRLLRAGQVLDSDPVTHVQVTVAAADERQVVLLETGAGHRAQCTYDARSGLLVGRGLQQQVGVGLTEINLTLQGKN